MSSLIKVRPKEPFHKNLLELISWILHLIINRPEREAFQPHFCIPINYNKKTRCYGFAVKKKSATSRTRELRFGVFLPNLDFVAILCIYSGV